WVAVSSRKSSNLLTVISIVAVPAAEAKASAGIPESPCYFEYFLISKEKAIKPAVTVGGWEKWKYDPTIRRTSPCGESAISKPAPDLAVGRVEASRIRSFHHALTQVPHLIHSGGDGRLCC